MESKFRLWGDAGGFEQSAKEQEKQKEDMT